MEYVYLLSHVHPLKSRDDEKLIGIYRTEDEAKAAIQRLLPQPGFSLCPGGFVIDSYGLDEDHWTEGYVTTE